MLCSVRFDVAVVKFNDCLEGGFRVIFPFNVAVDECTVLHSRLAHVAQWVHRKKRIDWLVVDNPLTWRTHEHRYLARPRDSAAHAVIVGQMPEFDDPHFNIATALSSPIES